MADFTDDMDMKDLRQMDIVFIFLQKLSLFRSGKA